VPAGARLAGDRLACADPGWPAAGARLDGGSCPPLICRPPSSCR